MKTVLILGGYGNFGKRIAHLLTAQGIAVIINGRNATKAKALVGTLPLGLAQIAIFDQAKDLSEQLQLLKPHLVINTIGPFQTSDYRIAKTCVTQGIHYIDLSDGRDFVTGIGVLDEDAKAKGVCVISGASTVPALSSAVIEHFRDQFGRLDEVQFGIAPGQKAERGLATTKAILGYVGKRLKPCAGFPVRYGWQDNYRQIYPKIGARWMANCDIPDLDLLPDHYGLKLIRFSAGMENPIVHLGIWAMSWLVRLGLPLHLDRHAEVMLRLSHWFDPFGSDDGGMHMILKGTDLNGQAQTKTWFIIALNGDGPYIPTIPAVILAKAIINGTYVHAGAKACVGLVSLSDYLSELKPFEVKTYEA